MDNLDNPDLDHLLGVDADQQKRTSALFLLKLKETRQLSQTAVDDVVEGCRSVFSHTISRLHNSVRAKLAEKGVDEAMLEDIFSGMIDPFDGLETQFKQEKYFKTSFGLIVSTLS